MINTAVTSYCMLWLTLLWPVTASYDKHCCNQLLQAMINTAVTSNCKLDKHCCDQLLHAMINTAVTSNCKVDKHYCDQLLQAR